MKFFTFSLCLVLLAVGIQAQSGYGSGDRMGGEGGASNGMGGDSGGMGMGDKSGYGGMGEGGKSGYGGMGEGGKSGYGGMGEGGKSGSGEGGKSGYGGMGEGGKSGSGGKSGYMGKGGEKGGYGGLVAGDSVFATNSGLALAVSSAAVLVAGVSLLAIRRNAKNAFTELETVNVVEASEDQPLLQ